MLLTPRHIGRAPLLRRHYPVSSLLWAPPTPDLSPSVVIDSHTQLDAFAIHWSGIPGSSVTLSMPAVPSHPGQSVRCVDSLLHERCLASPYWEGWPLPFVVPRIEAADERTIGDGKRSLVRLGTASSSGDYLRQLL